MNERFRIEGLVRNVTGSFHTWQTHQRLRVASEHHAVRVSAIAGTRSLLLRFGLGRDRPRPECDSGTEPGACGWFYLTELEKHLLGRIVVPKLEVAVAYVEVQVQEKEARFEEDGATGKVFLKEQVSTTEGEFE